MKKNSNIKEGLGVSGFLTVLTAIVTVISSVAGEFLGKSFGEKSLVYIICDRAFYVSLSFLLVEILFEVYKIRKATSVIASSVHSNEYIIFPRENSKLDKYIEEALAHKKARKVQIICYGTSKYGKIIDQLKERFDNIEAEVVVCSPDVTILDYNWDKDLLKNVIHEISKAPNITVYMSSIPPTIRGSLVLTRDSSPLFCTMQSYLIYTESKNALFRGRNLVPAIVAQDENSPILFDLKEVFEKEFFRLKSNSEKYDVSN